MPDDDNVKTHQTIEPVHVRADHPANSERSASTEPIAPAPPSHDKSAAQMPVPTPQPKDQKPANLKVKQQPRQQTSNNVTAAIIATVVIVLVLAGLAVLAYIKTQK